MSKGSEKPIRVRGVTGDRVRYVAITLGLTQGEIVEAAILNLVEKAQPEFDNLVSAIVEGDGEKIETTRAQVIGKLVTGEVQAKRG